MAVKTESWTTSSLEERETIISYDRLLDRWHIWTDEPKHARKYEKYINEQQPTRKGYNPKSGQLVMLEGDLINVNVIITKKRKYTGEQLAKIQNNLKKAQRVGRATKRNDLTVNYTQNKNKRLERNYGRYTRSKRKVS